MGRVKYSELRSQMTPESRKRAREMTETYLAEMEISELREQLKMTQSQLAEKLKVTQAAISKLEKNPRVQLDNLRKLVGAMGGKVEIRAVLKDRAVILTHASKGQGSSRSRKSSSKSHAKAVVRAAEA